MFKCLTTPPHRGNTTCLLLNRDISFQTKHPLQQNWICLVEVKMYSTLPGTAMSISRISGMLLNTNCSLIPTTSTFVQDRTTTTTTTTTTNNNNNNNTNTNTTNTATTTNIIVLSNNFAHFCLLFHHNGFVLSLH